MTDKPSVLFVCIHNAGRSQMAAGYLRHLGQGRIDVLSAGSAPADSINPAAVEAMAEEGIDISAESPRSSPRRPCRSPTWWSPWAAATPAPSTRASAMRTGSSRTLPGKGVESVRPIRDDIRRRVEELIAELLPAA